MAQDEVTLYNMALSAVGTSSVAHPQEDSREAEICRLWFPLVRDQILAQANWGSAKAYARLALLAERDEAEDWGVLAPEPGFRFVYSAPSDMIRPRYLSGFGRFVLTTRSSGTPHGTVRAIATQQEDAILVYTQRQENMALWDIDLYLAVGYALAAQIAMPLTGKPGVGRFLLEEAQNVIMAARVRSANEDVNEFDTVPDWLRARGYSGLSPSARYLYPYEPLISVSEMAGVG